MIKIGEINNLKVKRITDIAYMLEGDDTDIFLHFNETTKKLQINDIVNVFLYYDSKKRLAATTKMPTVTISKIGFGKCVNVKDEVGCFMDIGIAKDILLSTDYLPKNTNGWPKVGEEIPIILKLKSNTLICKIPDMKDLNKNIYNHQKGEVLDSVIIGFTSSGLMATNNNLEYIYIHNSLVRKKYHIGEKVEISIVGINQDNYLNGSLIKFKEEERLSDAEMILAKLNILPILPIGDKSTPEEIKKYFPLSKKAFKRATGALYKDHKIIIEDYNIKLIK